MTVRLNWSYKSDRPLKSLILRDWRKNTFVWVQEVSKWNWSYKKQGHFSKKRLSNSRIIFYFTIFVRFIHDSLYIWEAAFDQLNFVKS